MHTAVVDEEASVDNSTAAGIREVEVAVHNHKAAVGAADKQEAEKEVVAVAEAAFAAVSASS